MTDTEKKYLEKLGYLVRYFESERRERFYPFYLVLKGDRENPRFREALSIVKYFLDNALLDNPESEQFCRVLKQASERYDADNADYWEFAVKTPLPMQDYLKVIYDIRTEHLEYESGENICVKDQNNQIDRGLIAMFLKMTPEERVQSNDNAINAIKELKNAFRQ
ncbi:MAG: hypothetical protein GY749_42120 [Desulfobacteraceae bacterium]|nr:hypothetical protein [Desulfobacteraceae bacterium]